MRRRGTHGVVSQVIQGSRRSTSTIRASQRLCNAWYSSFASCSVALWQGRDDTLSISLILSFAPKLSTPRTVLTDHNGDSQSMVNCANSHSELATGRYCQTWWLQRKSPIIRIWSSVLLLSSRFWVWPRTLCDYWRDGCRGLACGTMTIWWVSGW